MSVLQDMTKGIMTTKATRAAGLTPVEGESGMTVAQAARQVLPNDLPGRFMSSEGLGEAARALRGHAQTLLDTAAAIDDLISTEARRDGSTGSVFTKAAEVAAQLKAAEAAADAAVADDGGSTEFKDRMARLSAEAQASVFTAADDGAPEPAAPASTPVIDGWFCVEHSDVPPVSVTSRAGRTYRMCGDDDCEQYEKE